MPTIIRRTEGTTHATAGLSHGMDRHPVKIAWIAAALASLLAAGCAGTRQREGEMSDRERYWHYASEEVPSFNTLGRLSGWR
ncbi:MAG TPA: hypothetical protein VD701_00535, partial [Steroidobacteraceae bacterium]|nr:hypothetical protein [Steroidobacteraceae bacterium]